MGAVSCPVGVPAPPLLAGILQMQEGEGGHDCSGPPVQCDVTRRERNTLCWVESSSTSSRGSFKQSGQYEGIQVQRPGEQRQGGQSMQVWG